MMSPLFIEFAGLPGAGKTTIARDVVSELTNMGYRCFCNRNLYDGDVVENPSPRRLFSKLDSLLHLVRSCIRHRRVAVDALACALRTKPRNFAGFQRAAQLLIRLDYIKSTLEDSYDLVIFDQGLIQYMWSISATGELLPDKYLVRLLKSVLNEVSSVIIFVNIDVASAIARVSERSTMSSRFDTMPLDQAEQLLARQKVCFDKIIGWSYGIQENHYLTVDGRQPVKKNAKEIERFIRSVPGLHSEAQVSP